MSLEGFYEGQAAIRATGADIDRRVHKAGRLFQQHLGSAPRLLDIGCGVGAVAVYLQRLLGSRETHGVEISEQRVAAARANGVDARLCDLNHSDLPYDDGSFDAVFCGEVIEHVVDPDHLLDEVGRVLAPAGVCVLTTPNLANWINRVALPLGWQPFDTSVSFRHEVGRPKFLMTDYGCRDHLRVFTLRALRELLTLHGFQILDVMGASLADVTPVVPASGVSPLRAALFRVLAPVDQFTGAVPALAMRSIVAFSKRA